MDDERIMQWRKGTPVVQEARYGLALEAIDEYTALIAKLRERVAELEAQNAELLALRKAVRESQERFIEVRKATGSSTPLADFVRLVALLRSTDTNSDLAEILVEAAREQDTKEAWDDWAFVHTLLCSSELKDVAALED